MQKKGKRQMMLRFYKGYSEDHVYKMDMSRPVWLILKFTIYGCLGMMVEVFFINIARIMNLIPGIRILVSEFATMTYPPGIPDAMNFPWKFMFGMTSLWMYFVYGTGLAIIEALYTFLSAKKVNMFIRAIFYTFSVLFVEFVAGWIYYFILGDFIWSYKSLLVTTSFSILPFWYVGGLVAEIVVKKMHEKDVEYSFRTDYSIPMPDFKRKN